MKLKTLVAVAVSSMLAASFAYAVPSSNPMDDTSTMQSAPAQENIGSMQSANSPVNSADMGVPGPASSTTPDAQMPMDTANNSDDMSADTATGDDDY